MWGAEGNGAGEHDGCEAECEKGEAEGPSEVLLQGCSADPGLSSWPRVFEKEEGRCETAGDIRVVWPSPAPALRTEQIKEGHIINGKAWTPIQARLPKL